MFRATALILPYGRTRLSTAVMYSPAMRLDACLRRSDLVALKRSIFPILEFDEWELSLTRGSALDPKWLVPGESLVSILWKFASANVLPGEALMHLISPRVGPPEGVAPVNNEIALRRLRRILRLPTDVLRVSMLGEAFHGRVPQAFRYCRLCASHGYHSVLYQLEDEDRCPAHQQLLRKQCPYCGGVTPVYRQRQRNRGTVSMRLMPFPFQLWPASALLYPLRDAQAGPRCHQTSLVSAIRQCFRDRVP